MYINRQNNHIRNQIDETLMISTNPEKLSVSDTSLTFMYTLTHRVRFLSEIMKTP